ncbi:MAG: hypothetical protein HeimC3_20750 [Candidatus Heimdallarchaeota archaeon LC_3]|nr:MAG: hypothetical protein HeimC3_20750 [Candidatus Heimdallarchaeota archaeon LC_3]
MTKIIIEICKKELKTRLGSKATLFPLTITFAIPLIIFLPRIYELFSSQNEEAKYFSLIFFLIIPVMIANTIGINSFINEIRWKTIKTLLIAPIEIEQIFLGKSLACIASGIIVNILLALSILITGIEITFSILILFFILGPLIVIYATFLLIIGTLKFPKIAESGGGIYFPIGGLLIVFLLFFFLQVLFNGNQLLIDFFSVFFISILSFLTYFSAKKLFNKENLVLSW